MEGANTDELFFYDAGVTILLSSNSYNNGNYSLGDFDLNDTGEVVWAGFEGNNFEMFVNDGAATTQLTFNDFDDGVTNNHAQINNAGDIVWISYDQPNASTLFLAKACTGLPVKNDIHSFDSFQLAYDSAADGDTIQGYAWHFPEDLIMDQNITVTLDGGYDCDHLAKVYRSSIHGSLTISDGAVTVENIVIQ